MDDAPPTLRVWRDISNAPYEISNLSEIRHKKKLNYLTPFLSSYSGELLNRDTVKIFIDGKPHTRSVRQLLFEAFPELRDGMRAVTQQKLDTVVLSKEVLDPEFQRQLALKQRLQEFRTFSVQTIL